jgi:hypothetical protein
MFQSARKNFLCASCGRRVGELQGFKVGISQKYEFELQPKAPVPARKISLGKDPIRTANEKRLQVVVRRDRKRAAGAGDRHQVL